VAERRRSLIALGRLVATLALVGGVLWFVDLRTVRAQLAHLDARWIAAYLLLSVPLYALYAWRWHFTAARVGAPIPYARAVLDYYLSTLLNQTLPLGVAGDVARVVRHRRRLSAPTLGPAASAVVLERLSGVAGLAVALVACALVWLSRGRHEVVPVGAGALLVVLAGGLLVARAARRPDRRGVYRLARDGRAALLERGAFPFQLAISTAAVAILLALFGCAGRAAGVPLDLATVVQVVPLMLASTTVPWAFAGWGVREASVATLYSLVGLDPAHGVAVSITFGLLSLAAAAPGLVVLALPTASETRS
jgi:glycosyltransferase 2 family protein